MAQPELQEVPAPTASPVLVVVVNDPADLARARREGWYRIPVARAPARIGAEWLALYQTAAFPPEERWTVRWLAAVHGYHMALRRELIPDEPDHPRAAELYYRIALGPLVPIEPPIRSRRLRRITFIPTTLARLAQAVEINDLWIRSSAQERLWAALKDDEIEAERQFPLLDDSPEHAADFALFGPAGRVAVCVDDEPQDEGGLREERVPDYLLAAGNWLVMRVARRELEADPSGWARRAAQLAGLRGL